MCRSSETGEIPHHGARGQDKGRSPAAALDVAAATSGRAVLISGFTVMAAMAGMFFSGNPIFSSFGIGTIIVVGVAMIGSLTFLPAVLSYLAQKGRSAPSRPAPTSR